MHIGCIRISVEEGNIQQIQIIIIKLLPAKKNQPGLAQLVERLTVDQLVTGSIPVSRI